MSVRITYTKVTVRMKPQTREWGVLIVNPRANPVEDRASLMDAKATTMDDFPLPFGALEHHHAFARIAVNPRQVYQWAQSFSQQIATPMEFADEGKILSV